MLCATDLCQVPPECVANSVPVLSVCFAGFNSAPDEGGEGKAARPLPVRPGPPVT
jgi:hypothetical protein